jgi:hypothetical protein
VACVLQVQYDILCMSEPILHKDWYVIATRDCDAAMLTCIQAGPTHAPEGIPSTLSFGCLCRGRQEGGRWRLQFLRLEPLAVLLWSQVCGNLRCVTPVAKPPSTASAGKRLDIQDSSTVLLECMSNHLVQLCSMLRMNCI